MAPLAAIALDSGCRVTGSDRELNDKTAELARRGAVIAGVQGPENVPADAELAIYSSAVAYDHPERAAVRALGIPELRRGEFLGVIARSFRRVAAISGAHGKTSITSTLVWILRETGFNPGWLIGGSVPGLPPGRRGDGDIFITEADESDGTHTALFPAIGIVPNADDDHAWSVGGEAALKRNFQTFAKQSKHLIYYRDRLPEDWFAGHPDALALTTDFADDPQFEAFAGFQRTNTALAVEAAVRLGADRRAALAAAATFPGVERRMTVRHQGERLTVIEDYAHHPKELEQSLALLRRRYPEHHLRVIFQPHRYARLAKYIDQLAALLKGPDSVLVTPVFAAWCEAGTVDSPELVRRIGGSARYVEGPWRGVAEQALAYDGEKKLLIAVIGAGDIEKVLEFLSSPGAAKPAP